MILARHELELLTGRKRASAQALLGHSSPKQTARYLRELEEVVGDAPDFGRILDKPA